jgi:hypothetical protein
MVHASRTWWTGAKRLMLGDPRGAGQMIRGTTAYVGQTADSLLRSASAAADGVNGAIGRKALEPGVSDEGLPFALGMSRRELDRLGSPSVRLPLQQVVQLIPISMDALRDRIPVSLEPYSLGGQTMLFVAANRFDLHPPLGADAHYNEVAYAVPVSFRGEPGLFHLKLHLNWQEGVDLGIQEFGFPKELRQVSYRSDDQGGMELVARERSGRPAFALAGREIGGLMSGWLTALQSNAVRELDGFRDVFYLLRGDQLVRAYGEFTTSSARPFAVDTCDLGWLERNGVVEPGAGRGSWPAELRTGTFTLFHEVEVLEQGAAPRAGAPTPAPRPGVRRPRTVADAQGEAVRGSRRGGVRTRS